VVDIGLDREEDVLAPCVVRVLGRFAHHPEPAARRAPAVGRQIADRLVERDRPGGGVQVVRETVGAGLVWWRATRPWR
jgi:hypothetical protein